MLSRDLVYRSRLTPEIANLLHSTHRLALRTLPNGCEILQTEKDLSGAVVRAPGSDGVVDVVASTGQVDRMGDIVDPRGGDFKAFKRNPVILVDHSYAVGNIVGRATSISVQGCKPKKDLGREIATAMIRELDGDEPVARAAKVLLRELDGLSQPPDELPPITRGDKPRGVAGQVQASIQLDNETEMDRVVRAKLATGSLRTVSIGFRTIEVEAIKDSDGRQTGGLHFKQWELLEISFVAVPANAGALVIAGQDAPAAAADDTATAALRLSLNAAAMRQRLILGGM